MTKIDKRDRADVFRARLAQALAERGTSRSALAARIGVDRSTISHLLKSGETRLPNAQIVAEAASALGVSADWLLGLSHRPEPAAEVLAAAVTLADAPRALVDERIFQWHQEAQGYKIRYVPATLPDMLKTDATLRWEYAPHLGRTVEQAVGAARDRLEWMLSGHSDHEIAMPLHELEGLATGCGYYAGLDPDTRREQIDRMIALHERLYPSMRVFLFDARRVYSAPVTVFGPLLAALYLGRNYLIFRDADRVQSMIRHFDGLIREAEVSPRDFPAHLQRLRARIA